mgnify:CR=1 FL=1
MDKMISDNIAYMQIDDTPSISGQSARQVPPQKPMESQVEVLNSIINKDTIAKENLKRVLEIKESERKKLGKRFNEVKEPFVHWASKPSFFDYQLNTDAKKLERMRGGMPFKKHVEAEAEIPEKNLHKQRFHSSRKPCKSVEEQG